MRGYWRAVVTYSAFSPVSGRRERRELVHVQMRRGTFGGVLRALGWSARVDGGRGRIVLSVVWAQGLIDSNEGGR